MSNLDKRFEDAETLVGLPSRNPYSLPFAHRKLFAQHVEEFDLFIYTEDDIHITERHVDAFLDSQSLLNGDEIAGFLRSEVDPKGNRYITSIHHHFHWLVDSIVDRGGQKFARLSNDHSGCFLATRDQLRVAIASGGFLVPPHAETYGMLETAASDLYRNCGFRRLINLSRIDDFVLPHMPNKYYPVLGIAESELRVHTETLQALEVNGGWKGRLISPASRAPGFRWSMDLYSSEHHELLRKLPTAASKILSIGSGNGSNEAWMQERGHEVLAIPIDAVFGAVLQNRGIPAIIAPFEQALQQLSPRQFDAIVMADGLHLVPDPASWLRSLPKYLNRNGSVYACVAHGGNRLEWIRDLCKEGSFQPLSSLFVRTGVHPVNPEMLRQWFREAGFQSPTIEPLLTERRRAIVERGFRHLAFELASHFLVVAQATH
ncbi:MAG: methyltransferase domain-containing protein [Opitutaceae bacterium]